MNPKAPILPNLPQAESKKALAIELLKKMKMRSMKNIALKKITAGIALRT